MKVIVIGLGNFGAAISFKLAENGHEVISVDSNMHKVDYVKDKVTYAVCLDCTDLLAMKTLPIFESDAIIVAIGEDFGASVLVTALLKKLKVKRIISRAISPIHQTILDALGVDEIINPEQDSADRFVRRIDLNNIINFLNITEDYAIIEVLIPDNYADLSLSEADLRKRYGLNVMTIKREKESHNLLGIPTHKSEVLGVLMPETKFKKGDVVFVFGKMADIKKWISTFEVKP
jgi:trk system potassium uptake protein TrkA